MCEAQKRHNLIKGYVTYALTYSFQTTQRLSYLILNATKEVPTLKNRDLYTEMVSQLAFATNLFQKIVWNITFT